MSWSQRAAAVGVAVLAIPVLANSARAQSRHGWTVCTPQSFSSCHSIEIGTTPIDIGNVRVGTNVNIRITNLQGSGYAHDNTTLSGLIEVIFNGQHVNNILTFQPVASTAVGAGSTGSANWTAETGTQAGINGYVAGYPFTSDAIGGCASGNLFFNNYTTAANTCGTSAFAVFNFTTGNLFDANLLDDAFIEAVGPTDAGFCFTDVTKGNGDPNIPQCNTYNEYVITNAPEPVTMALLGTGLFGIGGAGLRRRRKSAAG